MSDRGHNNSQKTSGFHLNMADVVVAAAAVPASLSTGDQQMLVKINKQWEGETEVKTVTRGRDGARH